MKKFVLLISIISTLAISACVSQSYEQAKITEKPNIKDQVEVKEYVPEDLLAFELNYQNLFCDLIQISVNFREDMDSSEYDAYIDASGSDIQKMRMIGNKYKTVRESLNIDTGISSLSKAVLKDEFSESIRLLEQSAKYLNLWIDGNVDLNSFEEFKSDVFPNLDSFYLSIDFAAEAYKKEINRLVNNYPKVDNELTANFTDLKDLCSKTIAITKSNEPKKAFIKLNKFTTNRESDNAFRIYGETSDNCSSIEVVASNPSADIFDIYKLSSYKKGDTTFKYGIREDWKNLGYGINTYTFTAHCDNNQDKATSYSLTFSKPSYSGLSNDNYYINSEGRSIHSPAYSDTTPSGATAVCNDGTYSFSASRRGTCSHHGGVARWL